MIANAVCFQKEVAVVSLSIPRTLRNDRNETNERLTTPLLQQRAEQVSAYYRQQLQQFSRPSSSSGASTTHSLRRAGRLNSTPQASRLRSSSADSPTRHLSPTLEVNKKNQKQKEEKPAGPVQHRHHRRAVSEALYPPDYKPHPALRISGRTHSAILYALEEAIRNPNPFTTDSEEENAQMSDLGGGRTSNGGPVPVTTTSVPAALNKPSDVMRNRRAREAKRQEETRLEEQRRRQQEEERRKSAERRVTAATGEPRYSTASSQYTPDVSAQQGAFNRLSSGVQVASGADYGVPTSRMTAADSGYASQTRRTTGTSQAQDQPRPAQTATAATSARRAPAQSASKQPAPPAQPSSQSQQQQSAGAESAPQESRSSSFPHAFERWEQLSSHWEGLTSYWLRRLETDAEEITRSVPSAAQMSRQINDLSAAGANLFHAVVELQRLRASSERKFQRWFFETRADTERNSEIRAQLEQQLQGERSERQRTAKERVDLDIASENARREVAETRRELMISKEEARRAWEELGRRNQESLELAESLKAGKMTIISGVQVMPIFGGPSRTASASQRPVTRDGLQQYDATPVGVRSAADDGEYYDQGDSPTNTDPFTESRAPALHHESGVQSLATGTYSPQFPQPNYGSPSQRSTSAGQQATPRATQQHLPNVSADEAEHFYQQAPQETFTQTPATVSWVPQRQASADAAAAAAAAPRSEGDLQSDSEDWEADAEADVQRRRELQARYGLGGAAHPTALTQIPPEAPTVPATSAAAMASYGPTINEPQQDLTTIGAQPDYEGGGYDGWENLGARSTHHPTRLSDVLEEDEERSSRRTAE